MAFDVLGDVVDEQHGGAEVGEVAGHLAEPSGDLVVLVLDGVVGEGFAGGVDDDEVTGVGADQLGEVLGGVEVPRCDGVDVAEPPRQGVTVAAEGEHPVEHGGGVVLEVDVEGAAAVGDDLGGCEHGDPRLPAAGFAEQGVDAAPVEQGVAVGEVEQFGAWRVVVVGEDGPDVGLAPAVVGFGQRRLGGVCEGGEQVGDVGGVLHASQRRCGGGVVASEVPGGVVAEPGVGLVLGEPPHLAGGGVGAHPRRREHLQHVGALVVERRRCVRGEVPLARHRWPRPQLVGFAAGAFGAGAEVGGAVGFEELGPGDVGGEGVAGAWRAVVGDGGPVSPHLGPVGGVDGEQVDEPLRGLCQRGVVGVAGGFPVVGGPGRVQGGWGEDLAAFASDVEAGAEPAGLVVADLDAVGPGEVEVSAAGAGEDFDGVGERAVFGFEVGEGVVTVLAGPGVDVEDPEPGALSGGDADAVVGEGGAPPELDVLRVGGGLFLPCGEGWAFLAGDDGQDSPASGGVVEGGVERGHAASPNISVCRSVAVRAVVLEAWPLSNTRQRARRR